MLKGKPLNVWDLKRDVMYKNDEMYNLMQALSVEDTTESLRYEKVILATDADVDGMHIRNLMITYFFKFFEPLVHDGHVYVLETPLFRVRNKQKTIYCYSEKERENAIQELGGKPEITRFKGLGEISPKEFAQFIGKEMRLSKVEYAPRAESGAHLQLLHGQEHAGAQGLHHGPPGRAGGGINRILKRHACQTQKRFRPARIAD